MKGPFEGRVAVVTGGGSGIGRAIAKRFAAEGATVFMVGRREHALDNTASEIRAAGGEAFAVSGDVCNPEQVQALYERVRLAHGGLDMLVNAAGVMRMGKAHETSNEDFHAMFNTNVHGAWLMSKHAVPLMQGRKNANIINISSTAGSRLDAGLGLYEASKSAVNVITKVMSKELAAEKIRVNAIAPGPVETELFSGSVLGDDSDLVNRREVLTSYVPFGRLGTPDEVARLAVFLASPESDFISGSVTTIDGAMGF